MEKNAIACILVITLMFLNSFGVATRVYSINKPKKCDEIIYANVISYWKDGIKTEFLKIVNKNLVYDPEDSSLLIIRVNSLSPLKPSKVLVNNIEVLPCVSKGVTIVEDMVAINFSLLGFRGIVRVIFDPASPRPTAYALKEEESFLEIESEGRIDLGSDVWGVVLVVISHENIDLSSVIQARYTLINHTVREISTEIGVIKEYLWKLLITGSSFTVKSIPPKILKMVYRRIFIYDAIVDEIGGGVIKVSSNIPNTSIYINPPFNCKVELLGNFSKKGMLSRLFNLYFPRVIDSLHIKLKINVSTYKVSFYYPNGTIYDDNVYVDNGIYRRIVSVGSITLPGKFTSGNLTIVFMLGSESIGCFKIYGVPPEIRVIAPLCLLTISLEDIKGKKVLNATVEVYRSFGKKVFSVRNGTLTLGYLPKGKYVIRVLKNGNEIGRRIINVESSMDVVIRCNLVDFEYQIIKTNGELVKNYTLSLVGMGVNISITSSLGKVEIKQLVPGTYTYTVTLRGRKVLEKKIYITIGNSTLMDIINLPTLTVKIVNAFGNPIRGVDVYLYFEKGELVARQSTDKYGKVVFPYLNKSTYVVDVPVLRCRKTVVLKGDEKISFRTDVILVLDGVVITSLHLIYIFLILVILSIVRIIFKLIKKKRDVIVLDIEDKK
ncbi:MAG: hypothetical protein DRJ35_03055 [Thermoprotei archaeon]|nr:MAG: hypothetical protein DRJ35_03055 [Thermoprotei archaeon]